MEHREHEKGSVECIEPSNEEFSLLKQKVSLKNIPLDGRMPPNSKLWKDWW